MPQTSQRRHGKVRIKKKLGLKNEKEIFQFIENTSHDLRIPCSGIASTVKILQQLESNPLKTELLNDILCATDTLLNIIRGIYDFDYVSSGNLIIENKKIAIHDLIKNAATVAKPMAQQKGLSLFTDVDKNIPKILIGDEYRITRILINLVNNAIKFTQKGNIKISAKLAQQNNKKVIIQLIVSDTGIGIPKNKQEVIYQRFAQLKLRQENQALKSKGLGLSIVKQFVQDLSGEINLASTVGKGSIFTCSLPLKLSKNIEEIKASKELPAITALKILLVEDDPLSLKTTKMLMESNLTKLPITTAELGNKALKLIKRNHYDVVFLDLELTDLSGLELTKKIRTIKKEQPLIIALTAHANKALVKTAKNIGIDAYLTKPIDIKSASVIIKKRLLQKKKLKVGEAKISQDIKKSLPIDIKTAKKRLNLKSDSFLQSLIDMLIKELPTIKKSLRSAFIKNDLAQIKQIMHKLQGGASYCGAYRLKKASADLENAIENKKSKKEITLLLQKVLTEINLANDSSQYIATF